METEDSNDNVPTEIVQLLESHMASRSVAINNNNAALICNILPGMIIQPLHENIPMAVEQENPNPTQFFGEWEHSGSWYHCIDGGRKNKPCLNFNNEVSPTIQQLFKVFF